jgi:hypothetical protein
MERDEIRLECLKLVANKGLTNEQALAQAKFYEKFVTGSAEENQPKGKNLAVKKTGNPDVLS